MPFTDAPAFNRKRDLHLLRGDPPIALWKLLDVFFESPTGGGSATFDAYRAQHNDVVIQLRPVFDFDEIGTRFVGSNIEIDQSTGILRTLKPQPPEPAVHNFILEAIVTKHGSATVPKWSPARLRVHVHQRVERIRMSPSRLSIHRPKATGDCNTNYGFTVRAEFDDGTSADITATSHYRADPIDADCFYDANEESPCLVKLPAALGPGSVRTLSVVTTPEWNSRAAHADIAVLEPWETAPLPTAVLVDGHPGVWDGTLKPEKVPNVVFMGSGFRPLDMTGFETMTNNIVHQMKTSPHLTPYNYLANSINYWRIFMPGNDAGVSVRCEVFSFVAGGQRFALPVPAPAPPPDTGVQPLNPKLTLGHLLYIFGLPVPSDLNLVIDPTTNLPPPDFDAFNSLDPASLDFSPLREKWRLTKTPLPMLDIPTMPPKLLKDWVSIGNRTFIDEIDAFPPLAVGEPPSAEFDASGEITFYGARRGGIWFEGGPERLAFFRRVSAEPRNGVTTTLDTSGNLATQVGNLWAEDRPGFTFDNRPFLVAIPNMPIGHSFRFFGRSQWIFGEGVLLRPTMRRVSPPMDLVGLPVNEASGSRALVLDVPPLSSAIFLPDTRDVCAHELGHAFGLGDEYTEQVPVPWGFEFVPYSNLMRSDAALNPDRTVQFGSLRWNWHRARKASVLTRKVDDRLDGTFHAFVAKGRGHQFAPDDSVRLRKRNPREPLRDPITSMVEFVVDSVHPNNIDDPNDALNMTIVLKNDSILIDVEPFEPGSVIYLPIPAPPPVASILRPYLTLISPAAERIMTAIGGTMSGKPCDTSDMKLLRAGVQVPRLPSDELEKHVPLRMWTRIAGAYYGGAKDACGILHASGSCFMRTGADGITLFCPACRFALVDRVDPEQHWRNDRDYEAEYIL